MRLPERDSAERGSAAPAPGQERSQSQPPRASVLQQAALGASVMIALSAVVTLLFTLWSAKRSAESARRSAEAQVQVLALGSLQHYLDLAVQNPDLTSGDNRPLDARHAWFGTEAMTTAQTLWLLVGREADWQRSINAIIRQNRSYLRSGAFVCDDFTPGFVSYLRTRDPNLRCAELGSAQ